MGEVNWLVSIIIGAVISVPVGILTNLLTPKIQDFIEKNTLSTQSIKVNRLRIEYEKVKELHDKPQLLSIKVSSNVVRALLTILVSFFCGLTVFFLEVINNQTKTFEFSAFGNVPFLFLADFIVIGLSLVILQSEINQLFEFVKDLIKLSNFEKYQKESMLKLEENKKSSKKK